jgi:hypothetical protein
MPPPTVFSFQFPVFSSEVEEGTRGNLKPVNPAHYESSLVPSSGFQRNYASIALPQHRETR